MTDAGNEPLIPPGAAEDEKEAEVPSPRIIRPKRLIVIEPILVLNACAGFTWMLMIALYNYGQFKIIAAHKLGINLSTIENNESHSICNANKTTDTYKVMHEAQTLNSYFDIITGVVGNIPCIFACLILGPYSDKAGRKYAIIIPLVGSLINFGVALLVVTLDLPVWYLLIGSFLEGLGGKYFVVLMGCFSYIADTTDSQSRQFRITLVELITFMSTALGVAGVGNWIESVGYFWPAFTIVMVSVITLAYAIFFVPETVVKDPSGKLLTFSHLKTTAKIFFKDTKDKRRWKLQILFIALIPIIIIILGDRITSLYLQNIPLCWGPAKVGYYNGYYVVACSLGGLIFAKLLKCFMSDQGIVLLSGFTGVVQNIFNALVYNDIMMYIVPVLAIMHLLFVPTVRAMMSNLAGPTEQGSVFSAVALLEVLSTLVGNVLITTIYSSTISIMSGFVFFIEAAFYLLGTIFALVYFIRLRQEQKQERNIEDSCEDKEVTSD